MKKGFALLVALMMMFGAISALAEAEQELPAIEVPSSWVDPEIDRASTIDILAGKTISSDFDKELVMEIYWADSAWEEWVYTLVLVPAEDGQSYSYQNGSAVCYTYDEDGMRTDEKWSNEAFTGTVTVSRDEDGQVVLALVSQNEQLRNLNLHQENMPCPSPEELVSSVIEPILNLEEETAGSEMKMAQLASDLIHTAVAGRYYAIEPGELSTNFRQALEDMEMTEEEYQVFLDNKNNLTDFIQVLSGLGATPDEEQLTAARELCKDAGVMDGIDEVLTSSLAAGASVDRMLIVLQTIENEEAD